MSRGQFCASAITPCHLSHFARIQERVPNCAIAITLASHIRQQFQDQTKSNTCASAITPISVISRQNSRFKDRKVRAVLASAMTPLSVICLQLLLRFKDDKLGHPCANAITLAFVICVNIGSDSGSKLKTCVKHLHFCNSSLPHLRSVI